MHDTIRPCSTALPALCPLKPEDGKSVAILLCTFNGERFLRDQLDSVIRQTHRNWRIYASDDGSTDGTMATLEQYKVVLGDRLVLMSGPRRGFAQNFMSLVRASSIEADFFAFCDQDDIWIEDKLERSISALANSTQGRPSLFGSRTELIDEHGNRIGFSPLFQKKPGFRNALVQSLAGANTMLINASARQLLNCVPERCEIVAHDWLAYILVSAADGVVLYDPRPTLLYRQHQANLIGANSSFRQRLLRLGKLLSGRFRAWTDSNLVILHHQATYLADHNRKILQQFELARNTAWYQRVPMLLRSRVYRQTIPGTITLIIAALLKRL